MPPKQITIAIRSDVVERKEQQLFIEQLAALSTVEITRAASAWSFVVPRLLRVIGSELELRQAFTEELFPHAREGFVDAYTKRGPQIYHQEAQKLVKELRAKNQPDFGSGQLILAAAAIEKAAPALKDELVKQFDRVIETFGK